MDKEIEKKKFKFKKRYLVYTSLILGVVIIFLLIGPVRAFSGQQYFSRGINVYNATYVWLFDGSDPITKTVDNVSGVALVPYMNNTYINYTTGVYNQAVNISRYNVSLYNNTFVWNTSNWTNITVCSWISVSNISIDTQVYAWYYDFTGVVDRARLDLRVGDNLNWRGFFRAGSNPACDTGATTNSLANTSWTHVCMQVDNTNLTMHVNGVEDNTSTCSTGFDDFTQNPTFYLGNSRIGELLTLNEGNVSYDELLIFNRSLTDTEIINIYLGQTEGTWIINQTVPTRSLESLDVDFNVTLGFNSGENPIVYLFYNGTNYQASQNELNLQNATYTRTLTIPLIIEPNTSIRTWNWNITDTGGQYDGVDNNHTVFRMNVTNCTDSTIYVINFTVYDEIGGSVVSSDLDSTWNFWATPADGTLTRNYINEMDGRTNFDFCIAPNWANLTTNAIIYYEATGYEPREYHLTNHLLDNTTENISLYLLSTGNATTFKLTVRDNSYLYYPDVIVRTLKYKASTDSFIEVESCTTDVDATCLTHLVLEDVDYRFMVVRPNGTIIHTTGNFRAYCPQSNVFDQCLFTVLIPPALSIGHYVWDDIDGLSYAVTHSNATNISTLTWSFLSGSVNYIRFKVSQDTTTICNTNSSAVAGIMNCALAGYNGTVKRQVFLSRSDELAIWTDYLDIGYIWQTFGDAGVFFLILIIITIGTASAVTGNPMAAIILVIAALGVAAVTGIGGIGMAPFILIAVAAAFIIFKLRQ